MSLVEVIDEGIQLGLALGVAAEVEIVFDRPVTRDDAIFCLEAAYLAVKELAAFEHGKAEGALSFVLVIGATTVKTHVGHLYEKLGVSDRAAAVAEAMRRGLIE